MRTHADDLLAGRVLLVAPHMDDGVLACGGTLAQLSDPSRVRVVYATDGRASPEPVVPWRDRVTDDLFAIRCEEARQAMRRLGVLPDQLEFLGLPDGHLGRHAASLARELAARVERLRPDVVVAPFRFDQNPDHLALHRAARASLAGSALVEYFVYYRLRLLPGRDLRRYLRPEHRREVDIRPVKSAKLAALACFTSQTTRFYPWQTRPNLTPELLEEVSSADEVFLRDAPAGTSVFERSAAWIQVLHALEPRLKRPKDHGLALLKRGLGRDG